MDAYLLHFKWYAISQGWDSSIWAVNLSMLLTGKGLLAYYNLSDSVIQMQMISKHYKA